MLTGNSWHADCVLRIADRVLRTAYCVLRNLCPGLSTPVSAGFRDHAYRRRTEGVMSMVSWTVHLHKLTICREGVLVSNALPSAWYFPSRVRTESAV